MCQTPRLPPGFRLLALDTVDSTNSVAQQHAAAGADHGTVVWATRQTAGRGRQGRAWSSPPGNLYCSIVLRPKIAITQAPQLSFVAAVALADALGALIPSVLPLRLKWPNDILLGESKAGGILIEAAADPAGRVECLILGLGVNLVSHPADTPYPTTDLRQAGAAVDVAELLSAFCSHLVAWSERWLAEGFAPVRAAWLARARGFGGPIEVRLGHALISGRFADLDEDGALIVESPDGVRRRVTAGDVVGAITREA